MRRLALGLAVGVFGGWVAGSGPINGDAAAYLVQAQEGDLSQRVVHLGYLAPAAWLGAWVEDLGLWLDWASVGAGVAIIWLTGLRHRGARGLAAAAVAASAVWPHVGYAEVDLHWVALLAGALWGGPALAGLCCALAVLVSPTALLALPWVAVERRDGAAIGGIAAAFGMVVGTGGDWWFGDRGVWMGPPLLPGRTAEAWGMQLPWLAALVAGRGALKGGGQGLDRGLLTGLALLPLLLAPPDVPTVLIVALALANGLARLPLDRLGGALLAAQVVLAVPGALDRNHQVREESRQVAQLAAQLDPQRGLVAPWSWGVRISVAATGDPYGLLWTSPTGPVRDQKARWCEARPSQVQVFDGFQDRIEAGAPWLERLGCAARPP